MLKTKDPMINYLYRFIKSFSYFSNLDQKLLKKLAFKMKITTAHKKTVIEFWEVSKKVYFLFSG